MTIEPVQQILDALGASYCLIGAHAMAARGYPRFTVDVDLLTTEARVLDRAVWAAIERGGAAVDPRRGDQDDPLAGVVHILLADGTDIDIMLARWKWEANVIARADLMTVSTGVAIRVPTTGDLVLLKLAAGGFLDLRDAAALLATGDRQKLVREIDAQVSDVHPDIRGAWEDLKRSI